MGKEGIKRNLDLQGLLSMS